MPLPLYYTYIYTRVCVCKRKRRRRRRRWNRLLVCVVRGGTGGYLFMYECMYDEANNTWPFLTLHFTDFIARLYGYPYGRRGERRGGQGGQGSGRQTDGNKDATTSAMTQREKRDRGASLMKEESL